jgi:hypothetical protein
MSADSAGPPHNKTLGIMATQHFRVRISTAILLVGLLGFPFAALWLPAPQVFRAGTKADLFLRWFFYDGSAALLGIAFIAALVTTIVLAIRKRWRSIPQHVLEMAVSLACSFFLPTY